MNYQPLNCTCMNNTQQYNSKISNSDTSRVLTDFLMTDIYSVSYGGILVYEIVIRGRPVMRRIKDNYVNATHMLTAAGLSKCKRTKILDNEFAPGEYEKVQGGFGRYQGTWVPLHLARKLASKYNLEQDLSCLLSFDEEEHPIVKHLKSSPQKVQKTIDMKDMIQQKEVMDIPPAAEEATLPMFHLRSSRRKRFRSPTPVQQEEEESNDTLSEKSEEINHEQLYTEAIQQVYDMPLEEKNHQIFLRMFTEDPNDYEFYALFHHNDTFQVNRAIDSDGNTALHWAITLASLSKAKWLIEHGADKKALNAKKESILCKALHSNSLYSNQSFDIVLDLMQDVLFLWDHHRRTLVHQIMLKEGEASFYYLTRLLHWLKQHYNGYFIQMFINAQDDHGNTPLHLAYSQSHAEAIRLLLDAGSDANIRNMQGKYPIDLNTHF